MKIDKLHPGSVVHPLDLTIILFGPLECVFHLLQLILNRFSDNVLDSPLDTFALPT